MVLFVRVFTQPLSLNLISFKLLCFAYYILVIGGSKVSAKLPVIQELLNQVKAMNLMGKLPSPLPMPKEFRLEARSIEDTMVETAKEILQTAKTY